MLTGEENNSYINMSSYTWERITSSERKNLKLCRLCGKNSTNYIDIINNEGTERELSIKVVSCLQINISEDDILPTIICTDCCDKLEDFYKFFKQAAEVQTYLDSIYQPTESQIPIDDQRVITIKYNSLDFYPQQQEAQVVINLNLAEGIELENLSPEELNKIIQEQLSNLNHSQVINNLNQGLVIGNINPGEIINGVIEKEKINNLNGEQVVNELNEVIMNNLESEEIIINVDCGENFNSLSQEYEKIIKEVSSEFNDSVDGNEQVKEVINSNNQIRIQEKDIEDEEFLGEEYEDENNEEDEFVKQEREAKIMKLKKTKVVTSQLTITEAIQGYPWRCTICNYGIMKSYKELQYHYKNKHNEPPVYKCMHCEREYRRYRSFTKHFLLHEDPKKFECDECGKVFNLKSSLLSHSLVHSDKRPYFCSICRKRFKSSLTLGVHKRLHLPLDGQFMCEICRKDFSSKKALENHEKMHEGVYDFMCDVCGRSFLSKSALSYHMATHTADRNYPCPTCGRSFRTECLLRRHLVTHSEIKKHRCDTCGKQFKERCTLVAHTRIHTGEMPYECEVCGKKFRFAGILTVHRRLHTGERPYICSFCKRTFTNWANLNKHMKRKHNTKAGVQRK